MLKRGKALRKEATESIYFDEDSYELSIDSDDAEAVKNAIVKYVEDTMENLKDNEEECLMTDEVDYILGSILGKVGDLLRR